MLPMILLKKAHLLACLYGWHDIAEQQINLYSGRSLGTAQKEEKI